MIIDLQGIGRRIREERKRLGLRQPDMARAAGVSLSTYVALEAGKRKLRLNRIERLSQMAGLDIKYILSGTPGRHDLDGPDWVLYRQIAQVIDNWQQKRGPIEPLQRRLDVLRYLYTQFQAAGRFDENTANELMNMFY